MRTLVIYVLMGLMIVLRPQGLFGTRWQRGGDYHAGERRR